MPGPDTSPAAAPQLSEALVQEVPVTVRQPPPEPARLDAAIPYAGMPRAYRAVSAEKPGGTPGQPTSATVLQQHCQWFDRDGDGVIWPRDTFVAFHDLGFNVLLSAIASVGLHVGLSWVTSESWIPNPLLPIRLARIHRAKHGSDTNVYDPEGRFVPQKFEEIFSKFDNGNKGGLDFYDFQRMLHANMNAFDVLGWLANQGEWMAFWWVARDEHGVVSKEKIRGQYDGSVWKLIAADVAARRAGKRKEA